MSIKQPRKGYRAATDPVFLAASVPAKAGDTVLELGCGVGVALLCLQARISGLTLYGVEKQANYAELARENAARNDTDLRIFAGNLEALPAGLRAMSFNHVIANPPFFRAGHGSAGTDSGREQAMREETPLGIWIDVAIRRLKPKGYLSLIHLSERLPELLGFIDGRLGSIEVKPLVARSGQVAGRVLVRARKSGRASFCLHSPLVIHKGRTHEKDGDDYRREVRNILRGGQVLAF